MRTIYRYQIPVDGQPQDWQMTGTICAVGCRDPRTVEFWAEYDTEVIAITRTFQVFGTGQWLPHQALYQGTAVAPGGKLVWHLFELLAVPDA